MKHKKINILLILTYLLIISILFFKYYKTSTIYQYSSNEKIVHSYDIQFYDIRIIENYSEYKLIYEDNTLINEEFFDNNSLIILKNSQAPASSPTITTSVSNNKVILGFTFESCGGNINIPIDKENFIPVNTKNITDLEINVIEYNSHLISYLLYGTLLLFTTIICIKKMFQIALS